MSIRFFLVLLLCLLFLESCTEKKHTAKEQEGEPLHWQNDIKQLQTLLEEKKNNEVVDIAARKMHELLGYAEHSGANEAFGRRAQQLLGYSYNGYLNSRRIREGIGFMDSISRIPILQQWCQYDLLVAKAQLRQYMGDNEQAIRWANQYMELPDYPDADRFILHAEAISGVYAYCSNDFHKAIRLLERAVELYRQGANYPHIFRVMSRLGIYYHLTGEYEKAVAANQEVISSYNDALPPQDVVIAYGEQANLYSELEMYDEALQRNSIALHYSLLKDSFGLGDLYRYRAEIFRKTGDRDSLFYYLKRGEETSAQMRNFKGVFVSRIMLADAYLDDADSVQKALNLALSICADSMRVPQWAKSQLNLHLGRALMKTGKEEQGRLLVERAAKGFSMMDMIDQEAATYRILMPYYRNRSMKDDFFRCYDRSRLFEDSLNHTAKMRAVAASNIRFGSKRTEEQNRLLSLQVKLQKRQLFYNIYISITLFLLLVCSVTYYMRKRKANRLLIEHSEQEIKQLIGRQQELNRHNEQLAKEIEQAVSNNNMTAVRQLTGQSLLSKEDENVFRQSFAAIYPCYLPKLREHYPQVTRNEELLAMLICMNQSTDEIAMIMGINRGSVNIIRSRLRKKMELTKEESLDDILKGLLS